MKVNLLYQNNVEIIESNNWAEACNNSQKKLNINFPLIITSKGNVERNDLSSIFKPQSIYSDISPDPTFSSCERAIKFSKNSNFDGVITIGGGSVMDTAKAVIASISSGISNLKELLLIKDSYKKKISSIFIPTTHGTGSEVTKWGTIWNMEEKKKYSISHKDLYPDIAILDGNLSRSLPLELSITTIMDALSHNFESIWNKNANETSTKYAIESIRIILNNVEEFKNNIDELKIRNNLLLASNLAGLAFSNTKTAAAHSISYPLTLHFGIPHGVASSITLIELLKINGNSIKKPLNKILNDNSLAFNELIKKIESIPNGIIPYNLSEWGIKKQNLDYLVSESFTKGRMDNNIVDLSNEQVKLILNNIF